MPWSRIIIDSRHKTPDSKSHADFSVELPWPVEVPAGTRGHVDAVNISHTWTTCTTGVNDRLYVHEQVLGSPPATHIRTLQLPEGQYNADQLKTALKAALTTGTNLAGAWDVTLEDGRLTISNDTPAANGWGSLYSTSAADQAYLAVAEPLYVGAQCNELIGHAVRQTLADGTDHIHAGQSLVCAFMDLQWRKQLFLHSSSLGETTCMSTSGASDIIRRVLVGGSTQGDVITDHLQNGFAQVIFGTDTTLNRLSFQLKDHLGQIVGLAQHQLSFEIVLQRPDGS